MIKVCHIVNLITGQADGVFAHLSMIFNNYDKKNFDHILIFQGGQIVENRLKSLNIKYYIVPTLNRKFSLKSFSQIFFIIRKENPDILHPHLIKPYIITGLINIILRKQLIFNYHGSFIDNDYNTKFEQLVYKLLHRAVEHFSPPKIVLVPSFSSKFKLETETRLFKNILCYYNGFDRRFLSEIDYNHTKSIIEQFIAKEFFVITMLARLNREKRFDRAVDIFEQLHIRNQKCVLFIFGDGEQSDHINQLAKKKGLSDSVFLLGFIKDAKNYMSLSHILLITSEREGMPMVLWEALAQGVPVVSSDVGGIKEILEPYNCGLVFQKDNIQEAVDKISLLIQNEELRKKMGENGKKIIDEKFNHKSFIQSIEGFYYSLINE